MNWKCVVVGLALVLPGTLFSVDGRHSVDNAAPSQEEFLDTLLRQEQLLNQELYQNSQRNEAKPSEEKKLRFQSKRPAEAPSNEFETGVAAKHKNQKVVTNTGQQERMNAVETPLALSLRQSHQNQYAAEDNGVPASSIAFIMVVAACTVLAAVGIVGAGVCWYKYHKGAKAASVVEYPAYGVTGPGKDGVPSPGDRKLAHSAQMYHYQHQKQQMIATMQMAGSGDMKHDASDDESGEDNDEADYTVYECPGLAPTGEMEVKNPLFCGEETPSTPVNDDSELPPSQY